MRLVALLLALLACGAEDGMAARRPVTHQGPVHTGEGFRTAGQVGGQSFAAYQPPPPLSKPSPSTVPLGRLTALAAGLTADRAYISRIKDIDDDIQVASVSAFAGSPAAGTATLGVALYEVVATPPDAIAAARNGTAYTLRLLPGCEWFMTVASGASVPALTPQRPTTLLRSKSYAAAVVWSTGSLLAGSPQSVTFYAPEAAGTQDAVTATSGFPNVIPVDEVSPGGTVVEYVAFRVRIDPQRPFNNYYDFY